MIRNKIKCKNCNKEISKSNYNKHIKKCNNNNDDKLKLDNILQINGKYICPECGKEYSKYGIGTHIWKSHTEIGKRHDPNISYKNGTKQVWIKGKTKYNNKILKNTSEKISKTLKNNPPFKYKTHTEEFKLKKSQQMKEAHKQGKAFNIKNSEFSYFSKLSQELFFSIYNNLPIELRDKVYFAKLNKEKFFRFGNKNIAVDFYIYDINFCIEFNGDLWHANPNIYHENSQPFKNKFKNMENIYAKEIWHNDKERIEFLKSKGIQTLIIWESDYLKNKQAIVKFCIEKIVSVERQNFK